MGASAAVVDQGRRSGFMQEVDDEFDVLVALAQVGDRTGELR